MRRRGSEEDGKREEVKEMEVCWKLEVGGTKRRRQLTGHLFTMLILWNSGFIIHQFLCLPMPICIARCWSFNHFFRLGHYVMALAVYTHLSPSIKRTSSTRLPRKQPSAPSSR